MKPPLLLSCRNAESEAVADRYGLIGETFHLGGCYTPSHRPQIVEVLSAVDGLDLPDLRHEVKVPFLPNVVRTIPGDSPLPFSSHHLGQAVATRYTQVGGLRQRTVDTEKVANWRTKRRLPDHKRLLLIQESGDEALESLFPSTLSTEFFPALRMLGDVVLVSPGYSVYDDGTMCEWLQLLNLKRSIFFAYQANLAGLPCVPCIGWHKDRPKDLERLVVWLVRQGGKVTHLAVNAQTGGAELWARLANGMAYLESATGRTYQWLVCGGTDPLRAVYARVPAARVTHVSATVPTYTIKHRLLGQRTTNDLPPDELLRQNIEREDCRRSLAAMMAAQAGPSLCAPRVGSGADR